jgi:UrcA family protein
MRVVFAGAALLAAGLLSAGGAATAQGSEEVSVQSTRMLTRAAGRTPSDVPLTDISVSYGVDATGLDPASPAGAAELARRVNAAALAACRQISRRYPEARPGDSECARAAADKAMAQLRERRAAAAHKAVATN